MLFEFSGEKAWWKNQQPIGWKKDDSFGNWNLMRSNSLGYPYTCKWGLGSFKWITLRKRCQSHISSCKIAAKPIWSIEIFLAITDITLSQAMLLFKRNPQLTVFSPPTCPQHKNHLSTRHLHLRLIVTLGFRIPSWYCWCFRKKSHSQPPEMDIAKKTRFGKIMGCQFTFPSTGWVETPDFWLLINVVSFSLQPQRPACLDPIRCSSRRCRWPSKKMSLGLVSWVRNFTLFRGLNFNQLTGVNYSYNLT